MKQLLDFLPILAFFASYRYTNLYTATAILMAATAVQMGILYAIDRKLSPLHKATLGLILAFGALTLYLHDERFIKHKPTVFYCAIACTLGAALWVWKKNLLQMLLDTQIQLPQHAWRRLCQAWIAYSLFMAALNAYIAQYFSTNAWMNFKLWGYAFPLLFVVAQGIYIARHWQETQSGETQA